MCLIIPNQSVSSTENRIQGNVCEYTRFYRLNYSIFANTENHIDHTIDGVCRSGGMPCFVRGTSCRRLCTCGPLLICSLGSAGLIDRRYIDWEIAPGWRTKKCLGVDRGINGILRRKVQIPRRQGTYFTIPFY